MVFGRDGSELWLEKEIYKTPPRDARLRSLFAHAQALRAARRSVAKRPEPWSTSGVFSTRSAHDPRKNRIARALEASTPTFDLSESNPTRTELPYPQHTAAVSGVRQSRAAPLRARSARAACSAAGRGDAAERGRGRGQRGADHARIWHQRSLRAFCSSCSAIPATKSWSPSLATPCSPTCADSNTCAPAAIRCTTTANGTSGWASCKPRSRIARAPSCSSAPTTRPVRT